MSFVFWSVMYSFTLHCRYKLFFLYRLGVNRIGEVLTDMVKNGLRAVLVFGVPQKSTKVSNYLIKIIIKLKNDGPMYSSV